MEQKISETTEPELLPPKRARNRCITSGCTAAKAPLLRLDVVRLDHFRPALGFAPDLLAQPLRRAADQAQARLFEALRDARIANGRVERRVQFLDRSARRAGRRHEAVPGLDDKALVAELFHRRHLGQIGRASRPGDGERPRLAGLDLRKDRGLVVHEHHHLPSEERGDRVSRALERHPQHVDAGDGGEPHRRQVVRAAHGADRRRQPAGIGLGVGDEVRDGFDVRRRMHGEDVHHPADEEHRDEILLQVVARLRIDARIDGAGADGALDERVAVGRGLGGARSADVASRARHVLDHDRCPKRLARAVGDDARDHVGGAAGSEGHDELHRLPRERLRVDGEARRQCEGKKQTNGAVGHGSSPVVSPDDRWDGMLCVCSFRAALH